VPKGLGARVNHAMESVSDQISKFEAALFDGLEFQLIVNTNRTFWDETGVMTTESMNGIEFTIAAGFDQMFKKYKHSREVLTILESWYDMLQDVVWIATDVPFPHDYEDHMDRVIANCKSLFNIRVRDRLEQAMIKEVSGAQIIQRNWREAWVNPERAVCKRRLEREFSIMDAELFCIREGGRL
jgi:hypothetical protein